MKTYISPVQLTNYIRAFFWAVLAILLFSCGASKKNIRKEQEEIKTESKEVVKNDLSISDKTKITIYTKVTDSTTEYIEEIETIPADKTKDKTIKRKIKRNKEITSETNNNTSNDIKTLDKGTKTSEKTQQNKTSKSERAVQREQFSVSKMILQLWWLWILLILLAIAWKYKKKLLL